MLRATSCLLAVSILLAGCATAPWPQEGLRNATVVPEAKERVWARIIKTTARDDLSVTGVDKINGVITAQLSTPSWDNSGNIHGSWAVCGGVGLLHRPLSQHADLNILVLPDPQGTRVTISARFTELRQDKRTRTTHRVRCTSTGVLEEELLDSYWDPVRLHLGSD